MSIYDAKLKDLRKIFQDFNHTIYGKTVFFLAYIIPIVLFLVSITTLIVGLCRSCQIMIGNATTLLCYFGIAFVLANIYFYSEIRKFCEYKEKISKKK